MEIDEVDDCYYLGFRRLLDDRRPTRSLDVWLARNVAGRTVLRRDGDWVVQKDDGSLEAVPCYVTGDSIDPIFDLAESFFDEWEYHAFLSHDHVRPDVNEPDRHVQGRRDGVGVETRHLRTHRRKLAIANALYRAVRRSAS